MFLNIIRQNSTSTSSSLKNADIVIVGGGLVGSALACKLSQSQWMSSKKICLLESTPQKKPVKEFDTKTGYSNRVVALNSGTKSLFDSIGAWNLIPRKKAFYKMFVWDHCSPSSIEFKDEDPIAHIIENDLVLNALSMVLDEETSKKSNLEVIYDAKIQGLDGSKIMLANGQEIQGELVIGADGANSVIRKSMTTRFSSKDYNQMGVVGTVFLEKNETRHDIAFQKFMPTGPLALLPLCQGRMSMVWTLPTSEAKRVKNLSPEDLAKEVNTTLNKTYPQNSLIDGLNSSVGLFLRPFRDVQVSSITSLPPPMASRIENAALFPLAFSQSQRYVNEKVALIGDAAHRIHPLAGQGVNLGYGDVARLVKALEDNIKHGRLFPSYDYLCQYETESLRHNLPLVNAIDGLQQLYCSENPLFIGARSVGLQFVNSNAWLKKFLMSTANNKI